MAMNSLEIPVITQEDLLTFHLHHFGIPFTSQVEEIEQAAEAEEYDEDGLGYYEDGVKRTLTDEQIAIFRHSEIETLLREQRRANEAAEAGKLLRPEKAARKPDHNAEIPEAHPSSDDDSEYERFLQAEREEFERSAAQKRRKKNKKKQLATYEADRTISTRRKVREMDVIDTAAAVLNYDDDDGDGGAQGKGGGGGDVKSTEEKREGRKIWWPAIGVGAG